MENERQSRPDNGYKARKTEVSKSKENWEHDQNRGYKKVSKPYQDKGSSDRRYQKKYTPSNSGHYQKGKDDDYDGRRNNESKKRMSAPSKDRAKDQQPDKMDIVKRLEKEKKAMQKKKQDSKKKMQSARPQKRVKRTNNIDWTKEYENDSYDDDDMSYYY